MASKDNIFMFPGTEDGDGTNRLHGKEIEVVDEAVAAANDVYVKYLNETYGKLVEGIPAPLERARAYIDLSTQTAMLLMLRMFPIMRRELRDKQIAKLTNMLEMISELYGDTEPDHANDFFADVVRDMIAKINGLI